MLAVCQNIVILQVCKNIGSNYDLERERKVGSVAVIKHEEAKSFFKLNSWLATSMFRFNEVILKVDGRECTTHHGWGNMVKVVDVFRCF